MKALRLTKPVVITGLNLFEQMSFIKFSPCEESGWFWKPDIFKEELAPINYKIVKRKLRRLALELGKFKLNFYEHIGALRWTGLTGVVVEANSFPPFGGRPLDYWLYLKPFCEPANGEKVPWIYVNTTELLSGFIGKKSRPGYIDFVSHNSPCLEIRVSINYPLFSVRESKKLVFPAEIGELEKIFAAYSLSWPQNRVIYYVLRFLNSAYFKNTFWAHKREKEEIRDNLLTHRFADILGEVSTVNHKGLPVGRIISNMAGHAESHMLIGKIGELEEQKISPLAR